MKDASRAAGQSGNSRTTPSSLCISIESRPSIEPIVSMPPPRSSTVRLLGRHWNRIALSNRLIRSSAGQPTRAAIGKTFGKPLWVLPLGSGFEDQEFISSSEFSATCSRCGSEPMEKFSPGKTPPSMLIGWLPGSNSRFCFFGSW